MLSNSTKDFDPTIRKPHIENPLLSIWPCVEDTVKKVKDYTVKIITHDGRFHTDEIMACAMLNYLYGIKDLIRTRDKNVINDKFNDGYLIIDVGGEYDGKKKFDHHQVGFDIKFYPKSITPMSSCGLIYKKFGQELLKKVANEHNLIYTNTIHYKLYNSGILEIDANDNGIFIKTDGHFHLVSIVNRMNAFDKNDYDEQLTRFHKAMTICEEIFISRAVNLMYKENMISSIKEKYNNPNTEIVIFNEHYNVNIMARVIGPDVKFIIFPKKDFWKVRIMKNNLILEYGKVLTLIKKELIFLHKKRTVAIIRTKRSAILLAKRSLV